MKLNILLLPILTASLLSLSCASYDYLSHAEAPVYSAPSVSKAQTNGLSASSKSSTTRIITKSANMDMEVAEVKEAADKLENIVHANKGYITSMNHSESKSHHASYHVRVPAANLVSTVDKIKTLGSVDNLRVWVNDQTEDAVKFAARLKELKTRRDRFTNMLRSASKMDDKIKVEEILSELEAEIFQLELAQQQLMKHSGYSKLSVSFDRKSIRGPLGALSDGTGWVFGKLFTFRN